jgi:hypothetical protein
MEAQPSVNNLSTEQMKTPNVPDLGKSQFFVQIDNALDIQLMKFKIINASPTVTVFFSLISLSQNRFMLL